MSVQTPKISEPIPGYSVKQRIGVGGYGEVWSAEAPGGLFKAIKFVYGYFDDARAARELKALERIKQVRHPFLLSLERYEIVDGQLLIVTELADMSLKDRFEQAKSAGESGIPRDELLGYLRDAADALDYMSVNFSLQHLDIKPENLLLVGGRVKVADFGLVKNLHDVTASMMGGLTPVYAAPEAFDDRPSAFSDQYSLAVLYQEMLTGVLPFPGRTAAQLAAQHLHARPRLVSLPAGDQPVVARALSKEPQQRYPSCRALIDGLMSAGAENGQRTESTSPKVVISTRDTVALKSPTVKTDVIPRTSTYDDSNTESASPTAYQTHVFGSVEESPARSSATARALLCEPVGTEPAVDLPPIEVNDPWSLRPTLFVGIGDTGARTLRRLRRKLRDRLGQTADVPAIRMLLLDTDAQCVSKATQGDRATALETKETLALPLRDAHAYASNSRYILHWLSRRWLYNIPRSMQTEGRRPLGRLAMVDHAAALLSRLQEILSTITSEQAIRSSTETSGQPFATGPRVYLVSSISGGAGGGMVLDVAYLLRKLLIEQGGSADDLYAVLTHCTDRNPEGSDLAIANALACLGELQEYRSGGYPGEPAYEMPALTAEESNLPNVYFSHLGDDLQDEELDAATESLATYLYLDSATPAGGTLDRCRRVGGVPSENAIRTFGIAEFGKLSSSLADAATELLCQQVLANWSGIKQSTGKKQPQESMFEPVDEQKPVVASQSELAQLAAAHARQQQIDANILRNQVAVLLEKQMGGSASLVLEKLWLAATQRFKPGTVDHADYALRAITHLFGPLPDDTEANHAVPILRTALEDEVQHLAEAKATVVREWILALIEQPFARLGGACVAREWYAEHVHGLDEHCAEVLRETQADLQRIVRNLQAALHPAPARSGALLGVRRSGTPTIDADDIFAVVEYRVRELELRGLHKLLRLISASLTTVGDDLKDLKSQLSRLTREHFASIPADPTLGAEWGDGAGATRTHALRQALPELARGVESQLQEWLDSELGGLRKAFANSHAMSAEVLPLLQSRARAVIVAALKQLPAAEGFCATEQATSQQDERLQACIEAARPAMAACGGGQRLIAVLPSTADESVKAALANKLQTPATLVAGCDAELICCFEAEGVPVANIAAKLVDCRTDLIRIAARLHTRVDVNWSNLGELA